MILAQVFEIGEGDEEDDMLTENFQRTEMSEAEEMRAFVRWMKIHGGTINGCATALNVSAYRVRNALIVAEGPENVRQAFEEGKVTTAVAVELCQVPTILHTQNLLFHAIRSQCSAKFIRVWREQIERDGLDIGIEKVQEVIAEQSQINYANTVQCNVCAQLKEYPEQAVRSICHTCWGALMELKDNAMQQALSESQEVSNAEQAVENGSTEHI